MKKMTAEQMKKAIADKKFYIVIEYGTDYYIAKDSKNGYSQVSISKERAEEWIALGAEVVEL